ncbi:biotin transporter BioY [Pelagibacteraceae bacterium]|nr:biotin transporter BioY [Pelagibacteraceae bacterium]
MEFVKNIKHTKVIKFLFVALMGSIVLAISSKIKIPFYPVPMTMQTLVVLMIGVGFGWKLGLATVSLYLFEGIIGLPVFSGTPEKGIGLIYFTGPTMGYLVGFLPAVFFAGLLKIYYKYNLIHRFILNFILYTFSVSFIYLFGLIWLVNFVPIEKIWMVGAMPFLPAELLKITILTVFVTFWDRSILSWRSF